MLRTEHHSDEVLQMIGLTSDENINPNTLSENNWGDLAEEESAQFEDAESDESGTESFNTEPLWDDMFTNTYSAAPSKYHLAYNDVEESQFSNAEEEDNSEESDEALHRSGKSSELCASSVL